MKRILVGAREDSLLSTLEVILKHWGYRVTVSSKKDELIGFLGGLPCDLLILEDTIFLEIENHLSTHRSNKPSELPSQLIVLRNNDAPVTTDIPHFPLNVPINIFSLFTLIQKHLEKQPRQNLRLTVKLPGMFSTTGEAFSLAEVLSLSSHGLFIKTGARLETGNQVCLAIPLMGMKRELEINGRILYRIDPGPANNYTQGYGIEFLDLDTANEEVLRRYIETTFFGEIAGKKWGLTDLTWDQMVTLPRELGLYLVHTS